MSNRPGIGATWLEKYADDVYPDDFVVLGGKKMRVPKYYDTLLGRSEPEIMERIKEKRQENQRDEPWQGERSVERLEVKEKVAKARQNLRSTEEL